MSISSQIRTKPLLFALSAGCAGFAVNHFDLPVFGGTALVFGNIFSLLTAFIFGPVLGGLAAAIAFSKTWLEWQQPAGFVCFTIEAIVVGWLVHRRRQSLLVATGYYWLWVGIPLTGLFMLLLRDIPFPANWAIFIKFPLNGLIMATFALLVGNAAWFRGWLRLPLSEDSNIPLRQLLFRRFGVIAVLPLVLLILLLGQRFDQTLRSSAQDALESDAQDIATQIDSYLMEHQRDLVALAQQLQIGPSNPAEFGPRMSVLLRQYPGFLTLLVADRSGEIIAAAPTLNDRGEPLNLKGMNVADRSYFSEVMRLKQPYISGVFRGRGFGDELIVAVSAPVFGPDNGVIYVLEASINLKTLIATLAANDRVSRRGMMVADSSGKVVLTAGEIVLPPLALIHDEPVYRALQKTPQTVVYDLLHGATTRAERHFAISTRTPLLKWSVVLMEPIWTTQNRVALFYALAGIWSVVAIGVALLLASGTAAEITRPLQQLVRRTRGLVKKEDVADGADLVYPSIELTEISRDLQDTARTLVQSNAQLSSAVSERDQSHAQLRQLLLHLDERVRDRTRQLDEARKAAETANHAKSEFLASMSHELRTPLNVILGMSEVLREQTLGALNEDQVSSVASVEESGRHLLSLINDILDLSKIEAGMLELDIQEVVIRDVSESSLRFIRESAQRKKIVVESAYRQSGHSLHADGRRLKQVLVNLLSNAVKFTPEGGRIQLEVAESRDCTQVAFSVQDTGIGISAENLPKLFRSFQQIDSALNRKYAGTGLGLALVKRMTEMHGGQVAVTSEVGKGTRFTVSIPVQNDQALNSPTSRPASKSHFKSDLIHGAPLILIAEDHPTNRLLLERHLSSRGCRLIFANDGQQAVEKATTELPALILMDVQMPVLDGLEATKRLRNQPATAKIPIITLTALAMPEDSLRCLEAGADAYLSKPLQLAELDRVIADQLNRA